MSIYNIILAPDGVLKEKAHLVDTMDSAIETQINRMMDTMYDANGIGLAANQVGLLNRIVVMDVHPNSWLYNGEDNNGVLQIKSNHREEDAEDQHPIIMVNPKIIHESEQKSVFDEGCLSLPGQYATIERPAKVRVNFLNSAGKEQEIEAEGLLSHCIQHEIDHLDGILFVDYLSNLKRKMIIRKMEKYKKQRLL